MAKPPLTATISGPDRERFEELAREEIEAALERAAERYASETDVEV